MFRPGDLYAGFVHETPHGVIVVSRHNDDISVKPKTWRGLPLSAQDQSAVDRDIERLLALKSMAA